MLVKNNLSPIFSHFSRLLAAVVFVGSVAATNADGADKDSMRAGLPTFEVPERPMIMVKSVPLVSDGVTLGTVVVYDDPTTPRPEDYLELYNNEGSLIVVAWFDRFGIERVAVDRSFVEGEDQLEGVFVSVVDDKFI